MTGRQRKPPPEQARPPSPKIDTVNRPRQETIAQSVALELVSLLNELSSAHRTLQMEYPFTHPSIQLLLNKYPDVNTTEISRVLELAEQLLDSVRSYRPGVKVKHAQAQTDVMLHGRVSRQYEKLRAQFLGLEGELDGKFAFLNCARRREGGFVHDEGKQESAKPKWRYESEDAETTPLHMNAPASAPAGRSHSRRTSDGTPTPTSYERGPSSKNTVPEAALLAALPPHTRRPSTSTGTPTPTPTKPITSHNIIVIEPAAIASSTLDQGNPTAHPVPPPWHPSDIFSECRALKDQVKALKEENSKLVEENGKLQNESKRLFELINRSNRTIAELSAGGSILEGDGDEDDEKSVKGMGGKRRRLV